MTRANNLAELAVILALNAKPHKDTLHKGTNKVRNALEDAKAILRHAATLHSLAMTECNGIERWDAKAGQRIATLSVDDQKRIDGRRYKIKSAVADIIRDYYTELSLSDINEKSHRAIFQCDPRGSAIKIAFKSDIWASDHR